MANVHHKYERKVEANLETGRSERVFITDRDLYLLVKAHVMESSQNTAAVSTVRTIFPSTASIHTDVNFGDSFIGSLESSNYDCLSENPADILSDPTKLKRFRDRKVEWRTYLITAIESDSWKQLKQHVTLTKLEDASQAKSLSTEIVSKLNSSVLTFMEKVENFMQSEASNSGFHTNDDMKKVVSFFQKDLNSAWRRLDEIERACDAEVSKNKVSTVIGEKAVYPNLAKKVELVVEVFDGMIELWSSVSKQREKCLRNSTAKIRIL